MLVTICSVTVIVFLLLLLLVFILRRRRQVQYNPLYSFVELELLVVVSHSPYVSLSLFG